MLSRRKILAGIGAATISAWAPPGHALARMLGWTSPAAKAAIPAAQPTGAADPLIDDRLRDDLARIASRADSEEGVPVILACESLVAEQSSHQPALVHLTLFNLAFASELRTNAAAWQRLRPNSPETDVATLIQLLAYRDFDRGRLEQRS